MGTTEILLTLVSGGIVGLILGLVGGGGSIMAVPLLVYAVGVHDSHLAIGTAAIAVAVNALAGLVGHARAGHVKWRCASAFAAAGMAGAAIGAELGKALDAKRLLLMFGLLMIGVGINMLRHRRLAAVADVRLTRANARQLLPRIVPIGFGVGLASGFFGIGGGFLIVPGLVYAAAMPIEYAIGTSLLVVAAFGLTTAASYALSGYVDWQLTALMIAGGIGGSALGIALGKRLAARKGLLERLFAAVVIGAGIYITAH